MQFNMAALLLESLCVARRRPTRLPCLLSWTDPKVLSIAHQLDLAGRKMADAALFRQQQMGDGAGLGNFYQVQCGHGSILSEHDMIILEYVLEQRPERTAELGSGAAQTSHCLSIQGVQATAYEFHRPRYMLALYLRDQVGATTNLVLSDWRTHDLSGFDLVFTNNLTSSSINDNDIQLLRPVVQAGGTVILRPSHWGSVDHERKIDLGTECQHLGEGVYAYR